MKKQFSEKERKIVLRALKLSNGELWDEYWDDEYDELLDWHLDMETLEKGSVRNSYGELVQIDPYLKRKILQEALYQLWEKGELEREGRRA